jgi:hypothetical protein
MVIKHDRQMLGRAGRVELGVAEYNHLGHRVAAFHQRPAYHRQVGLDRHGSSGPPGWAPGALARKGCSCPKAPKAPAGALLINVPICPFAPVMYAAQLALPCARAGHAGYAAGCCRPPREPLQFTMSRSRWPTKAHRHFNPHSPALRAAMEPQLFNDSRRSKLGLWVYGRGKGVSGKREVFQGKRPLKTPSSSRGRVEKVERSVSVQLAHPIARAGRPGS